MAPTMEGCRWPAGPHRRLSRTARFPGAPTNSEANSPPAQVRAAAAWRRRFFVFFFHCTSASSATFLVHPTMVFFPCRTSFFSTLPRSSRVLLWRHRTHPFLSSRVWVFFYRTPLVFLSNPHWVFDRKTHKGPAGFLCRAGNTAPSRRSGAMTHHGRRFYDAGMAPP